MMSPSLKAAPRVADWLDLSVDGVVTIRTGKVEIGQGILTALVQVAAEALTVAPDRISILSVRTGVSQNEGYTAGSMSVPHSATAMEAACLTCVHRFRAAVAKMAGVAEAEVTVRDGRFSAPGLAEEATLWTLAAGIGLDVDVEATDAAPPRNRAWSSLARIDLPGKIAGRGLIHDISVPGMLHGRVLRPPRLGAMPDLSTLDPAERDALVTEGGFVAVVDADPLAVSRRAERLAPRIGWSGGVTLSPDALRPEAMRGLPAQSIEIGERPAAEPASGKVHTARYQRPYLMHGSIGCVTALARWDEGPHLSVTSQTQGPYPLRDALAAFLGLAPEAVTVTHAAGAGCYGHNGADDVAADAALIAKHRPGHTVRVSWTRAEELASAPLAPAGEVEIGATLDADGSPLSLSLDILSATHARRPGTAPHGTLLAELHAKGTLSLTDPIELPGMFGFGGLRNAMPPYAVPVRHARLNLVDPPGLRTSAMRGLGTHVNVFAIEGFIDELAGMAGTDPLDYRLALLEDPRARAVLMRVSDMAGWTDRRVDGPGEGWGLAYSRYKDNAAYVACIAKVQVGETVQVERIWCAADAGRVVNMDGLRNQIEGGIVQSASWALFEEVSLTESGTLPTSWADYPILRFEDLPETSLEIIASGDPEPLGAGEVAVGPTTAAIANAASNALDVRIRRLPLSRDRVMEAMLRT